MLRQLILSLAVTGVMAAQTPLSTGHTLAPDIPGNPVMLNSLPMTLSVSPDGKWVAALNAGYGTVESHYMQSIAIADTATGAVHDFPEPRTVGDAKQTFYGGLVWSADGTKLYAAMGSTSDPMGVAAGKVGNGIAVYRFRNGTLTPENFLKLPLIPLAANLHTDLVPATLGHKANPFPAALALIPGRAHETLLVAENLSDTVSMVNATTGEVEFRFDLHSGPNVPAMYPIALAVDHGGRRAFVALWNASEVVELDLEKRTVARRISLLKPSSPTASGTHPTAFALDEKIGRLYVALANRDAVADVEIGHQSAPRLTVRGYFNTRLPRQTYFGAEPNAVALNPQGTRLYVANMGSDSVAVFDTHAAHTPQKFAEPLGFVPTELMPISLALVNGKLFVATDKGKGTGPNNMPQVVVPEVRSMPRYKRAFTYAPTLLHGSLAALDEAGIEGTLRASTEEVLTANRMKAAQEKIQFAAGGNPIRHVIYILKENRTYDQVLGDLQEDGKRVGNGDPSLTMYGASITPNQHKLALQFGVLDNFFDSGEVSGSGHTWSMAAIGTDYLEKTWQQNYRGEQRTYDYEGMVANGFPMLQKIPDVNEPASGYIFSNFAAHGKSIFHFAEYVVSTFCSDKRAAPAAAQNPQWAGSAEKQIPCQPASYAHGEKLPEAWGGGTNLWPWAIPRVAANTATKPALAGHFAPESPDFNLRIPDQIRVNVFLRYLERWKRDRAAGHDTMPQYILLRLPNDHTEGTKPGGPTPRSSIADNDLAIGRAVEAVSHSAFWDDTAFFILEDDAQNGGDHVDAHRSLALVISKYSPHKLVDSHFYTTVSMIRTMEELLDVPPMNNNDAFCSVMTPEFTGPGDQAPFTADLSNQKNGLIYQANKANNPGAAASEKMDFTHADRADVMKLNLILWRDAMGNQPPPAMLLRKQPKHKDDDDD